MTSNLSLRDRKKAKQREALADASLRLFQKQGYTATTLEQICAECEVTVPTLLRYFPTKEDLLFARQGAFLERCAEALARAILKEAVIEAWLHFLRTSAQHLAASPETMNVYKIILEAPTLLGKFHAIIRQYGDLLERALCEQAGVRPGEDLHARLLAHLLTVGPIETALNAIEKGDAPSLARRVDYTAKYVLKNFKRPENGRPMRAKSGGRRKDKGRSVAVASEKRHAQS